MKSKKKARVVRGRVIVYLIASAILFFVICGLAAGYMFLSAKWQSISFPVEYTVYYGSENDYKVISDDEVEITKRNFENDTLKIGQIADNQTVYVNFSALAEYCGFYVSGDSNRLRFILPAADSSEPSQFSATADSNRVDLNGTTVHLSAPAVMSQGQLYLPLEFVDFYIEGISVVNDLEDENVFYLLCSSQAQFYLTASPHVPNEPIDRSALSDIDA